MATVSIPAGLPGTAQAMIDEASRLAGMSKLLARIRVERAKLIRAFDRALQLFDSSPEGSPEQVQALAQLLELEVKIGEADRHLHDALSRILVTSS